MIGMGLLIDASWRITHPEVKVLSFSGSKCGHSPFLPEKSPEAILDIRILTRTDQNNPFPSFMLTPPAN
jgi:hypothetical protein